ELFGERHRAARGLLPVAERRVEDADAAAVAARGIGRVTAHGSPSACGTATSGGVRVSGDGAVASGRGARRGVRGVGNRSWEASAGACAGCRSGANENMAATAVKEWTGRSAAPFRAP